MLIMMKSHATSEEIAAVCRKIAAMGYKAHPIPGITRTAIGITGNQGPIEAAAIEALSGVGECVPVSKPYKLVGREVKEETTIIDLGDGVQVGGSLRSLPARAPSKPASKLGQSPPPFLPPAPGCSAEAPTNLALHPIVFRDSRKKGSKYWRKSARTLD